MKTLLDKLKPEIVEALEENRGKYDFSITDLYNDLDKMHLYSQLTVGQVRDIILYADINETKWNFINWKYGDKLFVQDN
jgi:hypothetical protein|tara:strand:- start:881 stop:1117 length:237 start_codon:yes stop_codon:yes gene_type:complete